MNPRKSAPSVPRRGIFSHLCHAATLWPVSVASAILAVALIHAGCSSTPVPTDPVTTGCSLTPTDFALWFENDAVSPNGVVKPANSLTFPDTPNCSFYQWSEQMFLWLTSPAPPSYGGGGGRIFNSPAFYDVSPLDENMDRAFIAHSPGLTGLRNLSLRAAQAGPHGLPVIMDKRGTMLEIERPQLGKSGKPLILDQKGTAVEIDRITVSDNKNLKAAKPLFFDRNGSVIQGARPLLRKELDRELTVQKFIINKQPVFLDSAGNVVEVEQGQADGSVLMAQTGSLVYYQTMVNDVYAYFLTGVKNGAITPGTHFPTSQADLDQITTYAAAHGKTFPDPEALAVEVKTAWIEVTALPNPEGFIKLMGTIPTYDQSNPNLWVPNGQKTVMLALVGMHVVGSTVGGPSNPTGHPEMIWATFEHKSNAPNATYLYRSSSGTQTVNPIFTSAWLFCAANPDVTHFNEPHMQQDPANPANIVSLPGFTISPSNTIRGNPWGATAGVSPNPVDLTAAASNSELISINHAVQGMLDPADVRGSYIMTGATWTINGGAPTQNFGNPGNTAIQVGRAVGTSQMANTTMETYQQTFPTTFSKFSNNCFACHKTNTTSVSHVFFTPGFPGHGLKPLF